MINDSFLVTFGVEFEAIFAFHETVLRSHLQDTNSATDIVKHIPDNIRKQLNQVSSPYRAAYPRYMGWALTEPKTYVPDEEERYSEEYILAKIKKGAYRGYAGEILTLAQSILPDGVRVHSISSGAEYDEFQVWHLTRDGSLVGVPKDVLIEQSRRKGKTMDDPNDWDSHGIELVSRILPFEPASFDEIEAHLAPLAGNETSLHTALISESCGMHVHVGLPPPKDHVPGTTLPTFDLRTLQHLAYIWVMYEPHISSLLPRSRREGGSLVAKVDLVTNLDNFIEEPAADDWDDEKDNFEFMNSTAPSLAERIATIDISESKSTDDVDTDHDSGYSTSSTECPTISFSTARAKIFTPDMTIEELAHLMGGTTRSHLVNWTYISRTGGEARTLEFRQHEGTTDIQSVKWWITFVVGLVRLAEHNSRLYGVGNSGENGEWVPYAGEGYRWKEWSEDLCVWDLFDGMGFEEEGKRYFGRRVEIWK